MRNLWRMLACAALIFSSVAGVSADPPKAKDKKPQKGKPTKPAPKGKFIKTKSGLQYRDIKVGKGPSPKMGQWVTVHYVGTFKDGKVFDSSRKRGKPTEFQLGGVIAGWNEGLQTMKVGGKRKLIVPPDLGYGPNDYGPIPGNSTLYFEVELLGVHDTKQQP